MHLLPLGDTTADDQMYLDTWRSLGERLALILNCNVVKDRWPSEPTSWRLSGWDPDILLVGVNNERTLTLPVDVALSIVVAEHGNLMKLHPYFHIKD